MPDTGIFARYQREEIKTEIAAKTKEAAEAVEAVKALKAKHEADRVKEAEATKKAKVQDETPEAKRTRHLEILEEADRRYEQRQQAEAIAKAAAWQVAEARERLRLFNNRAKAKAAEKGAIWFRVIAVSFGPLILVIFLGYIFNPRGVLRRPQ